MGKENECDIPPEALADENSGEILRAWIANEGLHVSLRIPDEWEDPGAWGIALMDVMRHLADAYQQTQGVDPQVSLIYRRRIPLMFDVGNRERPVGNGVCFRLGDDCAIVLIGKLSVVTYLHEFAHAIHGRSERKAVAWSVNLFRRVFPRQFARLRPNGHMLSAPVMAADSSLTGEVSRERQAEE